MPLAQRKPWKLTTIIQNVTGDGGQVLFYSSKRDALAHCEITFPPDGPTFWGNAPTPREAANIAYRQWESAEMLTDADAEPARRMINVEEATRHIADVVDQHMRRYVQQHRIHPGSKP